MDEAFFARTARRPDGTEARQPLEEHLRNVATLAGGFATTFGSGRWGVLAGILHDLGKYQPDFQRKLAGEAVAVEHSGVGAAWAASRLENSYGLPLAFAVAGHHSGLANLTVGGRS